MRRLLRNTVQRRLAIIDALREALEWQSTEAVAELLNCSVKTILSDVAAINESWGEYVGIDYSRSKGLRLNDALHNTPRQLSRELMDESDVLVFLERLFFQPNEDLDYWLNELFISEATFYRMIRQIDKVLGERGLVLERKPFRLTAPMEHWVRIFYVQLFVEKYGLVEWPFELERERLVDFIETITQTFEIELNDRELLENSYLLGTIIIRASQGFVLSAEEVPETNQITIDKLLSLRSKAEWVLAGSDYQISESWSYEVTHCLFGAYLSTRYDTKCQMTRQHLANLLEELEQVYDVTLSRKQRTKLLQKLLWIQAAYQLYPYPRPILFDTTAYFYRNAQLQYPHFTKCVRQLLLNLERMTGDPWFSQFYFAVLTSLFKEWEGLAHALELNAAKSQILVVSDSGKSHEKMLAELIETRFRNRVLLTTYGGSALTIDWEESFEKYDLVVSNFLIKDYPYDNLKIVDDFLTESDLSSIRSIIEK